MHDPAYMDTVRRLSEDKGGELGDVATMGPGGLRIVETSAGGVIEACTAVWDGKVRHCSEVTVPTSTCCISIYMHVGLGWKHAARCVGWQGVTVTVVTNR